MKLCRMTTIPFQKIICFCATGMAKEMNVSESVFDCCAQSGVLKGAPTQILG
jgi:hypothetical protein